MRKKHMASQKNLQQLRLFHCKFSRIHQAPKYESLGAFLFGVVMARMRFMPVPCLRLGMTIFLQAACGAYVN
jgi:hypothetical protein